MLRRPDGGLSSRRSGRVPRGRGPGSGLKPDIRFLEACRSIDPGFGKTVSSAASGWNDRLILVNTPDSLLTRLDDIGRSLESSGNALALIGLGSVGIEGDRLDAYSDLDFFAIVEEGYKPGYLTDLSWLSSLCPIAYHFRNTPDGYKLLFDDGIFCEFAVFEPGELRTIPFARGRIVWKQPRVEATIGAPSVTRPPSPGHATDWLVGEALTNLYVGLGRFRRGEKLSAARLIQHHAVDRVVELAASVEREATVPRDPFDHERRFEQRFPCAAQELPRFIQGYERSCESAQAILAFLERHFDVNRAMAESIRRLCDSAAR